MLDNMIISIGSVSALSLPVIIDADNSTVVVTITPTKTWITITAPLNNTATY
jgi:hypothetical protein